MPNTTIKNSPTLPRNSTIERIRRDIKKFQSEIPDEYNHVKMLDYLFNDDVDMFVSITTRGDGKTFNYLGTLLKVCFKYPQFKFMLLARHYTLRMAYYNLLDKIIAELGFNPKDVTFRRTDDYTELYFKNEPVVIITDLNNATDLKYHSNILKEYRLIVYDEFLAIDGDYLPDEAERLKTIYESVDRGTGYLLESPKIMLLGNPVNFNSPLLSYFSIMNYLETQPMNTIQQHDNMIVERYRNDKANEQKNSRIFPQDDNMSMTGEFKVNKSLVATDKYKSTIIRKITIKLRDGYYLYIHYANPTYFYLQIDSKPQLKYDWVQNLVDYTPTTPVLEDKYYTDRFEKKHTRGRVIYSDTFSISFFDRHPDLMRLNITRLIALDQEKHKLDKKDPYFISKKTEEEYEAVHMRQLIARLNNEYNSI